MSDEVIVERHGRVQVITINRPQAKNALNLAVAKGVAAAVDELDESDELRVGVLTGAGDTFSAGMDLKAFLTGEAPTLEGRGLCGIAHTPPRKPFIAAVEGWALAGGFELLLACDLIVAGESAKLGVPEVTRGLLPAGGGAMFLPKRIPFVIGLEMVLTGEPMTATRAAEVGLINRVVPDGQALDAALELANVIAQNGPLALINAKHIARAAQDWPFEGSFDRQLEWVEPVFTSEDAREGAAAFAEKRKPEWKGR